VDAIVDIQGMVDQAILDVPSIEVAAERSQHEVVDAFVATDSIHERIIEEGGDVLGGLQECGEMNVEGVVGELSFDTTALEESMQVLYVGA